jgi:hypothetical protein
VKNNIKEQTKIIKVTWETQSLRIFINLKRDLMEKESDWLSIRLKKSGKLKIKRVN